MSQVTDFLVGASPLTMTTLHTILENCFAALGSQNRGTIAPANPFEGMLWWDNSANPEILKRYTATFGWVFIVSVNITTGAISFYRSGGTALASAFALTLLDDADAAAVMTTLGFSAFFQTLIVGANAAAIRTLLGITASTPLMSNYSSGEVFTSSDIIPYDDSIPQKTEGKEWGTVTHTPGAATNKLIVDVVLNSSTTADNKSSMALFRDDVANALAASIKHEYFGYASPLVLKYYMVAGTTDAIVFKVRCGPMAAGTMTVNGEGAARKYGGVCISSITVTEIPA